MADPQNAELYDSEFFRQIGSNSAKSATVIVPVVQRHLPVESVADFGCANGRWLAVWKQLGVTSVLGLDGDYLDRSTLVIDEESEFISADLSQVIDLGRTFDLVQSLEVAEHLPSSAAETFVGNLVRHGRYVLFSAAVPGQLGINHINERPYEYWRDLFAKHDYVLVDLIRPAIAGNRNVEWWYRYNTFLAVQRAELDTLPAEFRELQIDDGAAIADIYPVWHKAFRLFSQHFTVGMSTRIASWALKKT